jgi:hypothetical protein
VALKQQRIAKAETSSPLDVAVAAGIAIGAVAAVVLFCAGFLACRKFICRRPSDRSKMIDKSLFLDDENSDLGFMGAEPASRFHRGHAPPL